MTRTGATIVTRVFVYGTLRRGERNHHVLAGAPRLGRHTTRAEYTLYDTGAYPAATAPGTTAVRGEVYTVDAATFEALDVLEDYPMLYTRRRIETPFGRAWIYLWIAAPNVRWPVIVHGDWCRRHAHKESST